VPRLDRLPEGNRKNLLALPVQVNDGTAFVPLRRPLAACRLAIVTTAGLHRRGDRPFGPADQTYREIYFEGRLAMKPTAGVRDRLDASDDPRCKAAAFGVAR
jgi:D-proline reductase (dithiol) PrdB